jgi:hypothetical protein
MTLAFKKTQKKTNFADLSKMIHGFVKTGKTTLAAQMTIGKREPLFLATEDGHHNLDVYAHTIDSWLTFKKVVGYIEQNAAEVKAQHSCFVIDLVSDLAEMCEAYVTKKLNIADLSDAEWGKGHRTLKLEFKTEVMKLWNVLPITFIAHSKEKEVTMDGDKVKMQAPSMSNAILEFINGKVDLVGFIIPAGKKNKNPMITFQPSRMAIAGSRYKHIATTFELSIDEMKSSYDGIQKAFEKQ